MCWFSAVLDARSPLYAGFAFLLVLLLRLIIRVRRVGPAFLESSASHMFVGTTNFFFFGLQILT